MIDDVFRELLLRDTIFDNNKKSIFNVTLFLKGGRSDISPQISKFREDGNDWILSSNLRIYSIRAPLILIWINIEIL
jgi:hypothetical protein